MKGIFKILKKHPVTIILYVIYTLLWLRIIYIEFATTFHGMNDSRRIIHNDGFAYASFAASLISVIFAIAMCVNAVFRSKDQTSFYLWMVGLIIVPLVIIKKISTW